MGLDVGIHVIVCETLVLMGRVAHTPLMREADCSVGGRV
jgi:hypothetical protein